MSTFTDEHLPILYRIEDAYREVLSTSLAFRASWPHPAGAAQGDPELRESYRAADRAFDVLWQEGTLAGIPAVRMQRATSLASYPARSDEERAAYYAGDYRREGAFGER